MCNESSNKNNIGTAKKHVLGAKSYREGLSKQERKQNFDKLKFMSGKVPNKLSSPYCNSSFYFLSRHSHSFYFLSYLISYSDYQSKKAHEIRFKLHPYGKWLHLYSVFNRPMATKVLYIFYLTFTHSFTHSYTNKCGLKSHSHIRTSASV